MKIYVVSVFFATDIKPAVKSALEREKDFLMSKEEFPCAETNKLNEAVVGSYMPSARVGKSWSKAASWMQKFFVFT